MPSSNEPLNGYEESIAFYYYIGLAITSWAHVELALYWILSACFTKNNRGHLALGFFSIENFRSRLQFADQLFKAKYGKSRHAKKWGKLHADLLRLSKLRNHLAHYTVMGYPLNTPSRRYALQPRLPRPSKFKQKIPKPPPDALCIKEIMHAQRQFSALAFAVEFLFYDLIQHRTPYPASFAQAGNPMTTVQLTRQIRAILHKPPAPSQP